MNQVLIVYWSTTMSGCPEDRILFIVPMSSIERIYFNYAISQENNEAWIEFKEVISKGLPTECSVLRVNEQGIKKIKYFFSKGSNREANLEIYDTEIVGLEDEEGDTLYYPDKD